MSDDTAQNDTDKKVTIYRSVKKFSKRDELIKALVDDIVLDGARLDPSQKSVLFILINKMDYNNIISIDTLLGKNIIGRTGLSKASVSRSINGLIAKEIILPLNTKELKERYNIFDDVSYILNPKIIGSGSFRDIKSLSQTLVMSFDFNKFEMRQETTISNTKQASDLSATKEVSAYENPIFKAAGILNGDIYKRLD